MTQAFAFDSWISGRQTDQKLARAKNSKEKQFKNEVSQLQGN
jgi:hypothetical protein